MECKKRFLRLKTIQLFATYVGFILYLACFSTPAWIVYSDGIVKRTSGLFQICLDNGQNDCSALEAKGMSYNICTDKVGGDMFLKARLLTSTVFG